MSRAASRVVGALCSVSLGLGGALVAAPARSQTNLATQVGASLAIVPAAPVAAIVPAVAAAPLSPVAPAAVDTLQLADVVRTAQERFPLWLAAKAETKGAEADLLAAEGGFDPLVRASGTVVATGAYPSGRLDTSIEQPTPLWGTSVFAGYRLGLGQFADYDGKLVTNDHGELRAGVRVPVLRDGPIDRRRATIQRAEIAVEIAKLGADQQKIEIARVTAQRYWDWAAAGARLAVVERWIALAQRRNEDLRLRVERGELADVEQLENERSVLSRRAQGVDAKRKLEGAAIDLSLFHRKADGSPHLPTAAQLPAELPEPPVAATPVALEQETSAALARRPEPKRAEAARASAAVALDLARNQALPAVDVVFGGSVDLGPGDSKRGLPVFEVAVAIDLPLLGRPQRGQARSAEAAVTRSAKQAELARDRVGNEVQDARSALEAARQRAEVTAQEVALAEKLEVLERRRFDLGDSQMLIVNLREQATTEARLRRIDALADFQKALAAQRAARGLSTVP